MTSQGDPARDAAGDLRLEEQQLKQLEENFQKMSRNPDQATLMLIAVECGMSVEDTATWFRIRNAQWRRSEGLPAEPGSVKD
ncbi:homeodomain-only protein [Arapaima gigas]